MRRRLPEYTRRETAQRARVRKSWCLSGPSITFVQWRPGLGHLHDDVSGQISPSVFTGGDGFAPSGAFASINRTPYCIIDRLADMAYINLVHCNHLAAPQ